MDSGWEPKEHLGLVHIYELRALQEVSVETHSSVTEDDVINLLLSGTFKVRLDILIIQPPQDLPIEDFFRDRGFFSLNIKRDVGSCPVIPQVLLFKFREFTSTAFESVDFIVTFLEMPRACDLLPITAQRIISSAKESVFIESLIVYDGLKNIDCLNQFLQGQFEICSFYINNIKYHLISLSDEEAFH